MIPVAAHPERLTPNVRTDRGNYWGRPGRADRCLRIIVGLLCTRLKINGDGDNGERAHDTWSYIQESDVLVGRMQIFNNWSPGLVNHPSQFRIGMEYFCSQGDKLWELSGRDDGSCGR